MNGVDMPLSFGGALEAFLTLRAWVRLRGFMLPALRLVSIKSLIPDYPGKQTYTSSAWVWKCRGVLGQHSQIYDLPTSSVS